MCPRYEGKRSLETGQAWDVFKAALWSLRGIGPKSAHEAFVGIRGVSSDAPDPWRRG